MKISNPPKVLVIGAGAIGGFYGAKLAKAGAQVSVVCRSDYEHVRQHGMRIESCWDEKPFHFKPHQTLRQASDYKDQADFILVATKVLPDISTIDLIKPVLHTNSSIILMQNGIHIEKPILQAFPDHPLISILAFVCVSKTGPGDIHHQDYGRLVIGNFPHGLTHKTRLLIDLFTASGVPCEGVEDVQTQRWQKLIWNAPFNPISVLKGGLNTKEMLEDAATKQLIENIMGEVCLLAKRDGCTLPEDIAAKNIQTTLTMEPYKTSMLLDFEAGRKMEIEAILGNAVRFAEQNNIPITHLPKLYDSLKRW